MGKIDKAKEIAVQSKDNLLKNFGPDHVFVAEALTRLGEISVEQGDLDGAAGFFGKAENIAKKSADTNKLLLARIARGRGTVEDNGGHAEAARILFEGAMTSQQGILGEFHPELAKTYFAYANFLMHTGNVAVARELLNKASAIALTAFLPGNPIFVALADKRKAL